VGSGLVVDELDAELRGKRPGDILKFTASLPERFGERAGEEVAFQVLVKEAKQKVLPEATDEWASEASEFETIAELRDDIRTRLDLFARIQARTAVREKVLDAVADKVDLEVPDVLVREEMERRLHDFVHRLEHQGMTIAQYLEATGQAQETFVAGLRDGSTRAVKADLALRAVVAQEAIEVSDDEVDAEVTTIAGQLDQKPEKVRRDLDRRGALEALRSEIARGKALQFLIDHATAVDEEGRTLDLTLPDAASAGDTTEANGEETVSTPDDTPDDEAHEEHEA
ncbi:MAG TPA: hypothetical protein VFW74_06125, partial [Acidimicrobiia bacterium]|nr:hypothetical protein [Acidimicrobiia bacterium]